MRSSTSAVRCQCGVALADFQPGAESSQVVQLFRVHIGLLDQLHQALQPILPFELTDILLQTIEQDGGVGGRWVGAGVPPF